MIEKELSLTEQVIYHDRESGRYYRRIIGGLGWGQPPEKGALVVVGEDLRERQGLRARQLWVVAEREVLGMQALYAGCLELRRFFGAERWVADKGRREQVALFNQAQSSYGEEWVRDEWGNRIEPIYLRAAALSDQALKVKSILELLDDLLEPGRKILFLGEESRAGRARANLSYEDMGRPLADFPWLAALGFAVAELILRQLPADRWQRQVQGKPGPMMVSESAPELWRR